MAIGDEAISLYLFERKTPPKNYEYFLNVYRNSKSLKNKRKFTENELDVFDAIIKISRSLPFIMIDHCGFQISVRLALEKLFETLDQLIIINNNS